VPLETIAFLGCGMQTGAGSILNELRPPAGSAVAVSGAGAVGLAAVMAARVSGCTTIVAIDLNDSRLALAEELGATHTINARTAATKDELQRITGGRGVNYILDTTAIPNVLVNLAEAITIRGTLALVGAAAPGTQAPLEIGASLIKGWTFKTIVQGSSVPQVFIPDS
jgi:aryl-alcohol dehydrogenase